MNLHSTAQREFGRSKCRAIAAIPVQSEAEQPSHPARTTPQDAWATTDTIVYAEQSATSCLLALLENAGTMPHVVSYNYFNYSTSMYEV